MTIKKLNDQDKLTFKRLFLFFVIFSFIGCIYEDIYVMIKDFIRYDVLRLVTKRGLLYFELSPIYGCGACLMIFIFTRRKFKKSSYFWLGSLLGGVFEYLASYIQELLTGTVSWNYSRFFLNINGRTNIPYMLFWGAMCYILMTKIYPYMNKKINSIPKKKLDIIYKILLVVISIDVFLSVSACVRLGLRHDGILSKTFYGEFLDKYYDDDRIRKSYTNMVDTYD